MNPIALTWILVVKDLKIEYRSRQAYLTTVFFALLILVIFNFAFDPGSPATREAASGILWVALLFPGIIRLNRSFQVEMEEGTLYGLILSPVDRGVLFLGKLLANWLFLMFVNLLVLLAFLIFYNFSFSFQLLWIALLIVLSALGFSAVGTLLGAMVSTIRTREVLLPVLLFPIILPIILPAVNGTQEILLAQEIQSLNRSVELLVAFDVIYLAAGFVLFEYVVAD